MSRERVWKDRRAYVQKDAQAIAENKKYRPRMPLRYRLAMLFIWVTKRGRVLIKRWKLMHAYRCRQFPRFVLKKYSHRVERSDPMALRRARNQLRRGYRRHFAFLLRTKGTDAAIAYRKSLPSSEQPFVTLNRDSLIAAMLRAGILKEVIG